jgi:Concanavalin A-like lectin/glucanases superfamily/Domain of unknown function (DUF2341)
MFLGLLVSKLLIATTAHAGGNIPIGMMPGCQSYLYEKTLTIDHTKVAGDLTNFPVLVNITDTDFRTRVNGGKVLNTSGYDLVFRARDTVTCGGASSCNLDFDVESYNSSTGALVAWVKIPLVSSTADTKIYVNYGNAAVTTFQGNTTSTWGTDFKAVWHLSQSPTSTAPQIKDASASAANGTVGGTFVAGDSVSGQIGAGLRLNGTNAYVSFGDNALLKPSFPFTVSAWVKVNSLPTVPSASIISTPAMTGTGMYAGYSYSVQSDGDLTTRVGGNTASCASGGRRDYTASAVFTPGTWVHTAVVYTAPLSQAVYVNGILRSTAMAGGATALGYGSGTDVRLGYYYKSATGCTTPHGYLDGVLDEVRVSTVAQTAQWLSTEYQNQSSPATFMSASTPRTGCF